MHKQGFWTALVVAWSWGCGAETAPPTGIGTILVRPLDLRTNLDPEVRSEVTVRVRHLGGERGFREHELAGWDGHLRVVEWPGEALVDGVLHAESQDGEFLFRFAPSEPLADGWYALQINLPELPVSRTVAGPDLVTTEAGWTTSRFRVGSFPIVRLGGVIVDDSSEGAPADGSVLRFVASEEVPLRGRLALSEFVDLTVNGEAVSCGDPRYDSEPATTLTDFLVVCPRVPDGASLTLRFRDGLFAEGVSVVDIRGNSPPVWSFRESERPDGDGAVNDALFEAAPTESAP